MTGGKTGPGASRRWSDGETCVLVDAWGPLYIHRNRSSLRMEDWRMVCSAVNAHHAAAGLDLNRNEAACKRRISILTTQYYKEEVAKGGLTSGWRHFARLRSFLDDPIGPPPGFDAKTPPGPSVKKEKKVEEASGCVGESAGKTKVQAKRQPRHFSLHDIYERSGGPSLEKTPATIKDEEVVGCGCELVGGSPAGVTKLVAEVTKLAEVFERVERERFKFEKEMRKVKKEEMETEDVNLERKKKAKAENPDN
ncbi:trihelix transcription factor ASIL1 [Hordeum vulgare]|nr:trihelix transcription factor ASIL1 [Hordeum vulgare]KAI4994657.1 hypothetical protein ZWY2020_034298 [Hordeum vulgare]